MATYLSGERYEILPPVLYTPDLEVMSSMMQVSTAKYDAARANIEKLYGDLYYGDLSNIENKAVVNTYFENLRKRLNELSTYNLADPRVAEEFRNLVKPLTDDKKLLYDYAFSRDFKDRKERIDQLKTAIPSKENGYAAYDSDIENMIYNKKKEYSLLSRNMPDEAYNVQLLENVNGFNAYAYFNDFAKDHNLKIKNSYIVNTNTGEIIQSDDVFKGIELEGQVIPNQYIIETEDGIMTLPEYADSVRKVMEQSPYIDYINRKTEAIFYNNLAANGYDYDKAYRNMINRVEEEIKRSAYYRNMTEEILNLSESGVSGEDIVRALMEETRMFYDKPILDYLLGDESVRNRERIGELKEMLENIEKGYLDSKEKGDGVGKVYGAEDYMFLKSVYGGLKRVNGYFDIGMTYANSKFSKKIREDENIKSVIGGLFRSSGRGGSSSEIVDYEANVFNYEDLGNIKEMFGVYHAIKNNITDSRQLESFLYFTSIATNAMKEIDPDTTEGMAELERYIQDENKNVRDENLRKYKEGYNIYMNYKKERNLAYGFEKISTNPLQPTRLKDKAFVASSYNSEKGVVVNLKDIEEFLIASYGNRVNPVSSTGSNISQSYPVHFNTFYDKDGNKYSVRYNMKLISSSGGSEEVKANSAVVNVDVIGPDGKRYGSFMDFMNDDEVDPAVKKAVSVGAYSTAVIDLSYARDRNLALAFGGLSKNYKDSQKSFSYSGSGLTQGKTGSPGMNPAVSDSLSTKKGPGVADNVNRNLKTSPPAAKNDTIKAQNTSYLKNISGKQLQTTKQEDAANILGLYLARDFHDKLKKSGKFEEFSKNPDFLRDVYDLNNLMRIIGRLGFRITGLVGENREGGRDHNGVDLSANKDKVYSTVGKYRTPVYVVDSGSDERSGGFVRFSLCYDGDCKDRSAVHTVAHLDPEYSGSVKRNSVVYLEDLISKAGHYGNLKVRNKDSLVLHVTSDFLKRLAKINTSS